MLDSSSRYPPACSGIIGPALGCCQSNSEDVADSPLAIWCGREPGYGRKPPTDMLGLFKHQRRRRLRSQPFPGEWRTIINSYIRFFERLSEADQAELLVHVLV